MPTSAGILVFKKVSEQHFFLLAHPGGPYYKNKSDGVWGIPKGLIEGQEEPLETAIREFEEETGLKLPASGFISLPPVKYKNGKNLLSWAIEVNELNITNFRSNEFEIEWPPKSGRIQKFNEIDQLIFCDLTEAKLKIHPVQLPLLHYVEEHT